MNNDNSSKQILLSVLGVAILVVAVVGVSFAAFTFSQEGIKENTITTGTVTLSYTEGGEGLSITDAMPTSDATGMISTNESDYFDFTINATVVGDTTIDYVISAEKVTEEGKTTLKDSDVKLYLETIDKTGAAGKKQDVAMEAKNFTPGQEVDSKTGCPAEEMILKSGTITANETTNYRLRMWLDQSYGSTDTKGESFESAKKFTVRVNVYAKAEVTAA